MTLHVRIAHVESRTVVIDADAVNGDHLVTNDTRLPIAADVVARTVTTREVTQRVIVTYSDAEGVRHTFERDAPGTYQLGGPRLGDLGQTWMVIVTDV